MAVKVFELSQALTSKWLAADIAEKRLLLEIICLNWTLDGVTLVPQMRKPFDLLVEGLLVSSSRGDSRFTIVRETADWRLARLLFPKTIEFSGEKVRSFMQPGLYRKRR